MSLIFAQVLADSASDSNGQGCTPLDFASATNTASESLPSIGQESLSSRTYGSLGQTDWVGLDPLISSAPDIHASPSASPDLAERKRMTAISGRKCAESLHSRDPLGSFAKTLLATSAWGSMKCCLTWKVSATPRGRLLFRLVPSELTTSEGASGLLPTLTVCGNYNRKGSSPTSGDGIITALKKLLPTLTARDFKSDSCSPEYRAKRDAMTMGKTLPWTLGGLLNPRWCESFMGYPTGWTELEPSETQSSRRSRKSSAAQS
jgi:hypothetical protein